MKEATTRNKTHQKKRRRLVAAAQTKKEVPRDKNVLNSSPFRPKKIVPGEDARWCG